jgi:(S)-2-hydroxyglutarate dehydrogenase
MNRYDYAIIGAGIVGVSVAYQLKAKFPKAKIILLEKEAFPFSHQTSHNSGVVHAGVYYNSGSLKSKFCIDGFRKTYEFCERNNIKYSKIGKLIVASSHEEIEGLHNLYNNADTKRLSLNLISKKKLKNIEPNLTGQEAIFSPNTGIVDWKEFSQCLLKKYLALGGYVRYDFSVVRINESDAEVKINEGIENCISTKRVVSCGGLQSDNISKMIGLESKIKIVPFRGDYYLLRKKYNKLFNHLIYPVPNPKMPFLGIHFTKTINGSMILGPNASINFSRERYGRFDINIPDIADYMFYGGFWKLLFKHKEYLLDEFLTSFSKKVYLNQALKYYNKLNVNELMRYKAGIRAQAITSDGDLVHDFLFQNTKNCLFVLNAPSPAATSSLPIGKYIVDKLLR